MTKTEKLQALWDSDPILMEATIEFKPFKGWYVVPAEMRHFTDTPDFAGINYVEAKQYIEWIQRKGK